MEDSSPLLSCDRLVDGATGPLTSSSEMEGRAGSSEETDSRSWGAFQEKKEAMIRCANNSRTICSPQPE